MAVLGYGPRMLNLDGDLPRHLLTGRYILETGSIPTSEPFVYPYRGLDYVPHEWLADVIIQITHEAFGLAGVVLLVALLLAGTFNLLYHHLAKSLRSRLPVFILVAAGAAVTSMHWATRPHVFSMLLLAVWLTWCGRLARGEKIQLWQFPLLMLLWSNLHGEFVAGMLALFAFSAGWTWDIVFHRGEGELRRGIRLWGALALSFAASLVNPAGFEPWRTMFGYVNNTYLMSRMAEARPPDFSQPEFYFLLFWLVFSIFLLAIKQIRLSTGSAFLLAGFSLMSLVAARNIHLYGIVAPFVLAAPLVGTAGSKFLSKIELSLDRVETSLRGFAWPILASLGLGAAVLASPLNFVFRFDPGAFPVRAVDWLESHPQPGAMFNNLDWGGYISFRLWPGQPVFIDSMCDTSGDLTRQFETVITLSDNWQDILEAYKVEWIIMPPGSALAEFLVDDPAWQILFADQTAVIMGRRQD
ncbi:MAG: hypothetical protein FJZ96_10795 [Chloroflexi bacterium]|nr:hypothetical protein [Chloroflexota bacterium]